MPLVTTKQLFDHCYGRYAVGAYNVNNLEFARAVAEACAETQAPFIFQISRGARKYAHPHMLQKIIEGIHEVHPELAFAVHIDHGDTATCEDVIGQEPAFFTSVMIDASAEPFEQNVAITKNIVEKAHAKGLSVEAEIGKLGGVEEDIAVDEKNACLTDPDEAAEFVRQSGCDSLAVAIGTSHGAYKFPNPDAKIHFDRAKAIQEALPERFPLVMHGSSSVPQKYVKQINEHGGKLANAYGVPEKYLPDVHKYGVCKVNIDSDLRLAWFAAMRKDLIDAPENFDVRKPFTACMAEVKDLVANKNKLLGSAGQLEGFKASL